MGTILEKGPPGIWISAQEDNGNDVDDRYVVREASLHGKEWNKHSLNFVNVQGRQNHFGL